MTDGNAINNYYICYPESFFIFKYIYVVNLIMLINTLIKEMKY